MSKNKRWTEEEIQFLKFSYPNKDYTTRDIATALDRTIATVKTKAVSLNLKRYKETVPDGYKRCGRCKTLLPKRSFYEKYKNSGKLQPYCKECNKEYRRVNLSSQENNDNNLNYNKTCIKCGETKNIVDFKKNRTTKSGYDSYCKKCHFKMNKEYSLKLLKERGW